MTYLKYYVQGSEAFDSANYPQIQLDIKQIRKETSAIASMSKGEILISFTRHHSLKDGLISQNPVFAKAVTSGMLPLGNIESLFEASSQNPLFKQQFEEYLKTAIT